MENKKNLKEKQDNKISHFSLENLQYTEGSKKEKYRAARGMAQGRGKQAGKGQSGQNKRGGVRPGFEGGQNPWFRRLPKIGFNNFNKVEYQIVTLEDIDKSFKENDIIDEQKLRDQNLISRNYPIKLLSNKNLKKLDKKFTIKVNAVSKSAKDLVVKSGGKIELI